MAAQFFKSTTNKSTNPKQFLKVQFFLKYNFFFKVQILKVQNTNLTQTMEPQSLVVATTAMVVASKHHVVVYHSPPQ